MAFHAEVVRPARMASAPVGVFTVTPPSFLESYADEAQHALCPRWPPSPPLFLLGS